MPSIPRYGQPQVREGIAQGEYNIKPSEEAFGGGKALAGIEATNKFAQQVMKVKDDLDQVAAIDAVNRLKQEKTRMMFDPKEGALAKRGKDSFNVIETYGTKYKEIGSKLETELKNDNQRKYFKKYFDQEGLELENTLSRHIFQEAEKFDDAQTEALLDNYKNDAILNYADENAITQSLSGIKNEVMNHASRKGKPAAWVKQKVQSAHSKVHAGVVAAYITNDQDQLAKVYFEANKDGFTATDRDAVLEDINQASLRGESQRASDSIFDKHQDSMAKAMAEARKIKDSKLRDETERRLEVRFAQKKKAEASEIEDLHIRALNEVDENPNGDVAIEKVPGWSKMSVSDRNSLRSYATSKAKGEAIKTDWGEYTSLRHAAEDPDKRATEFLEKTSNMMELRTKLSDKHYKEIFDLRAGILSGSDKTQKVLDGWRSDSMIVNDALASAGVRTGSNANKKDIERAAKFREMVDEQVMRFQDQFKRKATNRDVQDIVDDLIIKTTITSGGIFGFFGDEKMKFELTDNEKIENEVNTMPEKTREDIEAGLKRNGKEVTPESIYQTYQGVLINQMKKQTENKSGR